MRVTENTGGRPLRLVFTACDERGLEGVMGIKVHRSLIHFKIILAGWNIFKNKYQPLIRHWTTLGILC
jgi:hypothetical protein